VTDSEDLSEYRRLKSYAESLGQETYLELHAKNELLTAQLKEFERMATSGVWISTEEYSRLCGLARRGPRSDE
jgi:hypothetical protein